MTALRYVVLYHEGFGNPHFDVMFEHANGSDLITFRAPNWPPKSGDHWVRLGNHRRDYLNYEGPVSDNRGVVSRIAQGTLEQLIDRDGVFQCTLETGVELNLINDGREWLIVLPN